MSPPHLGPPLLAVRITINTHSLSSRGFRDSHLESFSSPGAEIFSHFYLKYFPLLASRNISPPRPDGQPGSKLGRVWWPPPCLAPLLSRDPPPPLPCTNTRTSDPQQIRKCDEEGCYPHRGEGRGETGNNYICWVLSTVSHLLLINTLTPPGWSFNISHFHQIFFVNFIILLYFSSCSEVECLVYPRWRMSGRLSGYPHLTAVSPLSPHHINESKVVKLRENLQIIEH